MERKRIEKLVALLLVGILIPVSLFPFHIKADTITNSNVNVNYYLDSVTEVSTGSYLQTYKVDFIFDQSYLGWISTKIVGTFVNNNTVPVTTSQFTYNKSIYVNGSLASTTVSFTTPNTISNGALQSLSQSIQNSNVTPLADLSTLDDILNVLTDIQNTLNIDVMDDLDQILIEVGLASDYLESLTKLRQYNIPIESYSYVSTFIGRYDIYEFDDFKGFTYPIFNVPNNSLICSQYAGPYASTGQLLYLIFYIDQVINISNYSNYLNIRNADVSNIAIFDNYYIPYNANTSGYFIKMELKAIDYGNIVITVKQDSKIIPIFKSRSQDNRMSNLSTDFCLLWGFSNSFLDNIQIIANGTQQSQSASGSLDQATSQFSDDANDLVTIEESFNNSMNQSLQSVNPTFNMGSSFLTSANWVSQQFNRIVNNTPFASLITFGLTLGLGLLIIGKVRK